LSNPFTGQSLPLLDGQTGRGGVLAAVARFDDREHSQAANDDSEALLDAALHQLAERCLLVQ